MWYTLTNNNIKRTAYVNTSIGLIMIQYCNNNSHRMHAFCCQYFYLWLLLLLTTDLYMETEYSDLDFAWQGSLSLQVIYSLFSSYCLPGDTAPQCSCRCTYGKIMNVQTCNLTHWQSPVQGQQDSMGDQSDCTGGPESTEVMNKFAFWVIIFSRVQIFFESPLLMLKINV